MEDTIGYRIKGAASRPKENESVAMNDAGALDQPLETDLALPSESTVKETAGADTEAISTVAGPEKDEEVKASIDNVEESRQGELTDAQEAENLKRYRMAKCLFNEVEAAQYGYDHYFTDMDTKGSQWTEPQEPYWIWDRTTETIDFKAGLQYPGGVDPTQITYNPKIHGNYDPTAPYAQYHNKRHGQEAAMPSTSAVTNAVPDPANAYDATGNFNRFTGNFQRDGDATEHHNQHNKAGRQLSAFYDTEAAANAHDGRSLKEERRNQKLTKQELKEMREKRKAKQMKKKVDWLKS